MEKLRRLDAAAEGHAREVLDSFIDRIVTDRDPNLAYFCLALEHSRLTEAEQAALIGLVLADNTNDGLEAAYQILVDVRPLDPTSKDALIEHIVRSNDKTLCHLVLKSVPGLGRWENKIHAVLRN